MGRGKNTNTLAEVKEMDCSKTRPLQKSKALVDNFSKSHLSLLDSHKYETFQFSTLFCGYLHLLKSSVLGVSFLIQYPTTQENP